MSEPTEPWDPALRPRHCGRPMYGILVDDLPRGLRRWICHECGNRQWFLYGEEIDDVDAIAHSWRDGAVTTADWAGLTE